MLSSAKVFIAVLCISVGVANGKTFPGSSGKGKTTRYWDCCKVTCAWKENAGDVKAPVRTCAADGKKTVANSEQSGCNGGNAFMCNNQIPFVEKGQAYAFAAANVNGQRTDQLCCSCYKLKFTDTAAKGKTLTVQVINTGSDLGQNHFDLQIPGGGFGIFNQGCPKQWPHSLAAAWGKQYGGVSKKDECKSLPQPMKAGCEFRFGWLKGADNPHVDFERVTCPAAIIKRSKCQRKDDN